MTQPTKHIVMFSGGAGSWATAKRVAEQHGTENLILLFADTKMEDEDLYRFLDESAANVGGELVKVAEGRDPWEVFFHKRYLGNTRIDPCSAILKRDLLRKWLEENCDPEHTVVYLGISWDEEHRFQRAQKYWTPWTAKAPLCDAPYLFKLDIINQLAAAGIEQPRLYKMGFPHNNCGGFCIKAGKAHFLNLLKHMPERYRYHEEKEQELRDYLDKDVTILREQVNGEKRYLTLRELRERHEADAQETEKQMAFDWGGCGCFSPAEGQGE